MWGRTNPKCGNGYYYKVRKIIFTVLPTWIRAVSMDSNCVGSLSTHDPNVEPHTVELDI